MIYIACFECGQYTKYENMDKMHDNSKSPHTIGNKSYTYNRENQIPDKLEKVE